jgi:hypothetical protein
MPIIWPIIPPSVRAAFSDRADEKNLIPARVLHKQHRRMERDAAYKKRLFETALVPEEVMVELEDECRERCVSLEFLLVERVNAYRDAGVDPSDWWKG